MHCGLLCTTFCDWAKIQTGPKVTNIHILKNIACRVISKRILQAEKIGESRVFEPFCAVCTVGSNASLSGKLEICGIFFNVKYSQNVVSKTWSCMKKPCAPSISACMNSFYVYARRLKLYKDMQTQNQRELSYSTNITWPGPQNQREWSYGTNITWPGPQNQRERSYGTNITWPRTSKPTPVVLWYSYHMARTQKPTWEVLWYSYYMARTSNPTEEVLWYSHYMVKSILIKYRQKVLWFCVKWLLVHVWILVKWHPRGLFWRRICGAKTGPIILMSHHVNSTWYYCDILVATGKELTL